VHEGWQCFLVLSASWFLVRGAEERAVVSLGLKLGCLLASPFWVRVLASQICLVLFSYCHFSSTQVLNPKLIVHVGCLVPTMRHPVSADLGPVRHDRAGVAAASYDVRFTLRAIPSAWPGVAVRLVSARHGVSFHGAVSASTVRRWLLGHSDGQRRRQPAAMASTAQRRPLPASISSSLTTAGTDLGLTGLDLGSGVSLFLKTDFSADMSSQH
jgi:hypothetical protein